MSLKGVYGCFGRVFVGDCSRNPLDVEESRRISLAGCCMRPNAAVSTAHDFIIVCGSRPLSICLGLKFTLLNKKLFKKAR